MGSTLEHGIYLPSEGEKNCYQGLASNWNKVDGALGDVAGLKQLIESKFTKEIVTELPTEDINPYCIYMILKTDPETNNIYDEWVYINNAWEYLGNTQVDMTQYYTKQEVNELPAVASGVTSTKVGNYDIHLADSNIHVTSADKSKWNTVALIKQLRLVNAQVGSATTIAFANIDDTNGIKVGDKCMDLDAKMFEITAVDTTNETVTVGSALIDLALDANVVHTNRNDDVSIPLNSTSAELGVTGGYTNITFLDKNDKKLSGLTLGNYSSSKLSYARLNIFDKDTNNNEIQDTLEYAYVSNNANAYLRVNRDNFCALGSVSYRWKGVYATNYYYGNDNVEFSTKFVTTDTNQTISGAKTFSEDIVIGNSDITQNSKRLVLRSYKTSLNSSNPDNWGISFNAGASYVVTINASKDSNGTQGLSYSVRTQDSNDNIFSSSYHFRVFTDGNSVLEPGTGSVISLGRSTNRWKDVQTNKVNGLTPSSLGMPVIDRTKYVDISGYFTNTGNGDINTYSVTANGWIYLRLTDIGGCQLSVLDSSNNRLYGSTSSGNLEQLCLPVVAGTVVETQWTTSTSVTVAIARFIPCQGNI